MRSRSIGSRRRAPTGAEGGFAGGGEDGGSVGRGPSPPPYTTPTFPREQKARKLSSVLGLAWLRWGVTALCCVPAAAFVAAGLIGTPAPRRRPVVQSALRPRTVILVPAHNEQAVIEGTLANLRGELNEQ